MDTDELSDEVYNGIIIEADNFLHELMLHFGVLASSCSNEDEYIISSIKLIKSLRQAKWNEYLEIFWGKVPSVSSVHAVLEKIEQNILIIDKIPLQKRKFTRWGKPRYVRNLITEEKKVNLHRS